ncbi:acyl carrier protein [Streptomyces angustmyceticus]|uniref:acyl carrier protein n=1 Tax=Streptomyces angustmyceticus TaxID=285578 RepID=UPI00344D0D9D
MQTTRAEITKALAEIISEIASVSVDTVREDSSFTDDLAVDSLSMVEISVAAEERFAVTIPDEEVKHFTTVRDVVDHIAVHQS